MITILLVEDDTILQQLYQDKLTQEGFAVENARNGEEAMAKLLADHHDLIILDLVMPKMTGFEVLQEIKSNDKIKKVPILVLTNIMADQEDLIKNWDVTDCLLKSEVEPEHIIKKIRTILKLPEK